MLAAGDLVLATGDRIDRSLTLQAFVGSRLAVPPVVSGSWHGFALGAQAIGHDTFLVTLRFDGDRLAIVELAITLPDDGTTWEAWSEATESARQRRHDAWLAAQLGPSPWRYAWGTIESTYDPRGGSSGITLRYD